METTEYKWRDRLILLLCWFVVLFSAITNWALASSTESNQLLPEGITWLSDSSSFHLFLFLTTLAIPILLYFVSTPVFAFSWAGLIRKFQENRVYWILIGSFNFAQILFFDERFRRNLGVEFLLIVILVAIFLWFFYRRSRIDLGKIVLALTMGTSILLMRQNLLILAERVDFFAASWVMKVFLLCLLLMLLAILIIPIIQVVPFLEQRFKRIRERLEEIPLWAFCLLLGVSAILGFYLYWSQGGSFESERMLQGLYLVIVLTTGRLLLWVIGNRTQSESGSFEIVGNRPYVILLGLLLVIYGILAVRIGTNRLHDLNPDGLAYLSIARSYAEGNLAVRGYWAPLLSWLVAPLIYLGATPHVSFQIVSGVVGLFWILTSVKLADRFGVNHMGRLAVAAAMVVIVLAYGFSLVTPDILGALFISLYFYWITHPAVEKRPVRSGLLIGLSGALAYYAKYYNLPFVLAHIFLVAALSFFRRKGSRAVLVSTIVSISTVLVLISPWILALHQRYGYFTITTSSGISRAIVGPDANVHPCWDQQLCDQPLDLLNQWEDPQPQYYSAYGWSAFASLENFRYQIRLVKTNLWDWGLGTMFRLGPILPFSLVGAGIMVLLFWSDPKHAFRYGWVFLTIVLYASGYMFTFSGQFRYYFPVLPILMGFGFLLLQKIFKQTRQIISGEKTSWVYGFMAMVYIMSVLSLKGVDLVVYLFGNEHTACEKEAAIVIRDYLEAPFAGTDPVVNYLSYYTRVPTVGVLSTRLSPAEADLTLREFGVRTFIGALDAELTSSLASKYSYDPLLEVEICDIDYAVLRLPE